MKPNNNIINNIYIHYGHTSFDPLLFTPITNKELFVKPTGGLWASPINAKFGWKQWNEDSDFRECKEENSFKFMLTKDANVLHIYSTNDLINLPRLENPFVKIEKYNVLLDFETLLKQGYDAIELHLSEEKKSSECFIESLYYKFYGWDCDSILIMNPDIVVPL